jgi:ElaB/YqjD/DUF883 family membrane-anchored ribosome-binding protein
MNKDHSFKERASEAFDAVKDRVNVEEAQRAYLNGRRYVKSHPVAAVALSLSAGILIGYLAKTIVDRRRNAADRGDS